MLSYKFAFWVRLDFTLFCTFARTFHTLTTLPYKKALSWAPFKTSFRNREWKATNFLFRHKRGNSFSPSSVVCIVYIFSACFCLAFEVCSHVKCFITSETQTKEIKSRFPKTLLSLFSQCSTFNWLKPPNIYLRLVSVIELSSFLQNFYVHFFLI